MQYEIIFNLNELGQQIVGKTVRSFIVDIDESGDIISQINDAVTKCFPIDNLYTNFTVKRSMADSNVGDVVEMHNPSNDNVVIGEIDSVNFDEIRVYQRNDKGELQLNNFHSRYTLMGREIGPNEKNKWWITPATKEEIEQYDILRRYDKMIGEILDRTNNIPNDYDRDPEDETRYLNDLTADQLQRILAIFNE